MTRRPRVRTTTARCPACKCRVTVEIPPLVYARHLMGRREADAAWKARCVCGEELVITVGEARRAA